MKIQKKEKGITLIALVITIIVLLILAGVSINTIVGENGVLNKAQEAVTKTKKASLEEEVQLLIASWKTDNLVNKATYSGRSETTTSGAVVTCVGDNILVIDNSDTYTAVLNNGEVGELTKQELEENSQIYKAMHPEEQSLLTENNAEFEYVEGNWNTGFVIREKATGDEFVWIPVVSEASYVRKSGSKNNHMSEHGIHDDEKDVTQYVLGDKLGLSTILGKTIVETERSGNIPGNIPEKEIVCEAGGFYVSRYEIGIKERKTAKTGDQLDADWTKENLVSQEGKEPARNMIYPKALELANTWKVDNNNRYQSGLITGTAWDVMCNFIGWDVADGDCTLWGNYKNTLSQKFENIEISPSNSGAWTNIESWQRVRTEEAMNIFQTGRFINKDGATTAQKNIYDVAGNLWEFTTEKTIQIPITNVIRGGSVKYDGTRFSATMRDGWNDGTNYSIERGVRVILYVK